jgi:hypothetical protein
MDISAYIRAMPACNSPWLTYISSYKFDHNDLIVVLVGPKEDKFQVHKDTLCERSKFFEAAVSTDRWTEGQEKVVRLPEVAQRALRTYVHWVYRDELNVHVYWQKDHISTWKEQETFFEAYMLAEYLDDSCLRTLAMDGMISNSVLWDQVPGSYACHAVGDGTAKGSPLRRFVLEWRAQRESKESFADDVEDLPKEFLEEMVVLLMNRRSRKKETHEAFAIRMQAELLPNWAIPFTKTRSTPHGQKHLSEVLPDSLVSQGLVRSIEIQPYTTLLNTGTIRTSHCTMSCFTGTDKLHRDTAYSSRARRYHQGAT